MENARLFSHFIAVENDNVHVALKKFYLNKKFSCSNFLFKFIFEAQPPVFLKCFLILPNSSFIFLIDMFLIKKDVYWLVLVIVFSVSVFINSSLYVKVDLFMYSFL